MPESFVYKLVRYAVYRLLPLLEKGMRCRSLNIACYPRDTIGREIVLCGLYERKLLGCLEEMLSKESNPKQSVMVDVGANIGNHSLYFSRLFKEVIAFEPNPIAIHLFRANMLMNRAGNVRLYEVGLGDAKDQVPFFIKAHNLGSGTFSNVQCGRADFVLQVEVGDDVLEHLTTSGPITFVKVDVEGYEKQVIWGLRATLQKHKPIIAFELHSSEGSAGGNAIFSLLRQFGYKQFYAIERPQGRFQTNRVIRLLARYCRSSELTMKEIDQPEDRYYSLVVASWNPLLATKTSPRKFSMTGLSATIIMRTGRKCVTTRRA